MQNVTCQDQNAEIFEVHVQNLCCLLDVCGVAARGGEGELRERTATGAALLSTPHGNHGDNQQ